MIIGDICLVDGKTNLKAADIETDKYEGRKLLRSPRGETAVLMKSKDNAPVTRSVFSELSGCDGLLQKTRLQR